jgi:tryptophan synthase beta subunit
MVLTCGDSDIASNILATDTDAPTACSGGGTTAEGVWYTFTGTGQEVTISTDNAGTNFDTQINIFSGTCGSLVCVGGDDDSGTGTTSTYTFTAANGTDYYIYVDGDGAAEGQFEISLSCADVCIANPGTWQY